MFVSMLCSKHTNLSPSLEMPSGSSSSRSCSWAEAWPSRRVLTVWDSSIHTADSWSGPEITTRTKEGNVLFNDTLSTFDLQIYGIKHMVKDRSDSERRNSLPPLHGLLFPISSKGSFICFCTFFEGMLLWSSMGFYLV